MSVTAKIRANRLTALIVTKRSLAACDKLTTEEPEGSVGSE